jgi:hypothetical protein
VTTADRSYISSRLGRELAINTCQSSALLWQLIVRLTKSALLIHGIATSNEGLNDSQCIRIVLFFQDEFFAQRRGAVAAFLVATASENLTQRQFVLSILGHAR